MKNNFIKIIRFKILFLACFLSITSCQEEEETYIPEKVSQLAIQKMSKHSFKLKWKASSLQDIEYVVDLAKDKGFDYFEKNYKNKVVTTNQIVFDNLDTNLQYFARVKIKKKHAESDYSDTFKFMSTSVTGIKIIDTTAVTPNSISFIWGVEKPNNAITYILESSLEKNFSSKKKVIEGISASNNEINVNDLNEGTDYYFRLRTKDNTEHSNIFSVSTDITKPIIDPKINNEKNSISFTWPKNNDATAYLVELSEEEFFYKGLITKEVKDNVVTFDNLKGGTLYYVRLKTVIGDKSSEFSEFIKTNTTVGDFEFTLKPEATGFTGTLVYPIEFRPNEATMEVAEDIDFKNIVSNRTIRRSDGRKIQNDHDFKFNDVMYYSAHNLTPETTYYARIKVHRFMEPRLTSYSKTVTFTTTKHTLNRITKITNNRFEAQFHYKNITDTLLDYIDLKKNNESTYTKYQFVYDGNNQLTSIKNLTKGTEYKIDNNIISPTSANNNTLFKTGLKRNIEFSYTCFWNRDIYSGNSLNYNAQTDNIEKNIEKVYLSFSNNREKATYSEYDTTKLTPNDGIINSNALITYYLADSNIEFDYFPYFLIYSRNIPANETVYVNNKEIKNTIEAETNMKGYCSKIVRKDANNNIFETIEIENF